MDFWLDMTPEADCVQVQEEDMEGSLEGVHVLLCEDNELNREIALYLLEANKATVDCAQNGMEAARSIRALDRQDALTVPIFAMTANVFEEDTLKSGKKEKEKSVAKLAVLACFFLTALSLSVFFLVQIIRQNPLIFSALPISTQEGKGLTAMAAMFRPRNSCLTKPCFWGTCQRLIMVPASGSRLHTGALSKGRGKRPGPCMRTVSGRFP